MAARGLMGRGWHPVFALRWPPGAEPPTEALTFPTLRAALAEAERLGQEVRVVTVWSRPY